MRISSSHAGGGPQRLEFAAVLLGVANDADHGSLLSAADVGLAAEFLDAIHYVVDLFFGGLLAHVQNHRDVSVEEADLFAARRLPLCTNPESEVGWRTCEARRWLRGLPGRSADACRSSWKRYCHGLPRIGRLSIFIMLMLRWAKGARAW